MNDEALFALDARRPLSTSGRIMWAVGVLAFAALTLIAASQGEGVLQQLVWVPITHSLVVGLVCAFTAALLFGQASTGGRRGYVWLGVTYLYVAGLLLGFPLFFPGTMGGDEPILGGWQSSITIFYLWHITFVVGILATAVVLWSDQRNHRRPGLRRPVWVTIALVIGAVLLTDLILAAGRDILPTLIDADGRINGLAGQLDMLVLALAIIACLVAGLTAWDGAEIQRWLFAVSLLALGEAVVNFRSIGRWSVAWYYDRLLAMIALTSLFAALVWIIARIGRATSRLAMSDGLTGCESRASFTASLDREIAAAQHDGTTRALLWIDLDGFKSVNDQVGHAIGDEVLRTVVRRLSERVRPTDHVGRLGGDEFGVLLSDPVSDDRISVIADRMLSGLRDPIVIDNATALVTGSIGVATCPADGTTASALLSRADLAMYAAKNSGGDRWTRFSADLGSLAAGRADLRHNLAAAVRSGQFELDVQPIVAVAIAGEPVIGVEVLARWQTETERLPAGQFIEFATTTGQIIQIGRQVLDRLEQCIARLIDALPPDGFVAVNLSVKELTDDEIVQRLLLGPLGRYSRRLVLEVTESAELKAGTDADAHLDQLRLRGYSVAVDDFGAGFSNFSRLEQLRPLLLKIDRSLVVRAADEFPAGGTAFLEAAVSVGRNLGCGVVAEGVETPEQLQIARDLGIDFAQGYLLGRPMPVESWPPVPLPVPVTLDH
ncbi:MAG: EAL domain-containing protein [Candidatus Nanopelagicales bacterium]